MQSFTASCRMAGSAGLKSSIGRMSGGGIMPDNAAIISSSLSKSQDYRWPRACNCLPFVPVSLALLALPGPAAMASSSSSCIAACIHSLAKTSNRVRNSRDFCWPASRMQSRAKSSKSGSGFIVLQTLRTRKVPSSGFLGCAPVKRFFQRTTAMTNQVEVANTLSCRSGQVRRPCRRQSHIPEGAMARSRT
jgi:hypothetical protein